MADRRRRIPRTDIVFGEPAVGETARTFGRDAAEAPPVGVDEVAGVPRSTPATVGSLLREQIQFPPFTSDHLDNSLSHLAEITASWTTTDR